VPREDISFYGARPTKKYFSIEHVYQQYSQALLTFFYYTKKISNCQIYFDKNLIAQQKLKNQLLLNTKLKFSLRKTN
jgi:hypothetical protein